MSQEAGTEFCIVGQCLVLVGRCRCFEAPSACLGTPQVFVFPSLGSSPQVSGEEILLLSGNSCLVTSCTQVRLSFPDLNL